MRPLEDTAEWSKAKILAQDPKSKAAFYAGVTTAFTAESIRTDWDFLGRPKQQWPDGDWDIWALVAGRGFGKTATGSNATRKVAESGEIGLIHLIAPTPADYRDVMIEGDSGILKASPRWNRPTFYPSKRLLQWPSGVRALCFSAEDPEALRGPQCGFLWGDEPASWTYGKETFDMAQFGLRLKPEHTGPVMRGQPRQLLTTTPKPLQWFKDVLKQSNTHVTRGSTYENLDNLAAAFANSIIKRYEGTTLGNQELLALIAEQVEGALWTQELIHSCRTTSAPANRVRVVVAVDPAVTSNENSDETGIIVSALGDDEKVYILEDCTPGRVSPNTWAQAAVAAYHRHGADAIVAEVNNGGDLVSSNIATIDRYAPVEMVRATRGKERRAQPVVSLFEQKRAKMLGFFPELEEQMTQWSPIDKSAKSPDRMDAMVWGVAWLTGEAGGRSRLIA